MSMSSWVPTLGGGGCAAILDLMVLADRASKNPSNAGLTATTYSGPLNQVSKATLEALKTFEYKIVTNNVDQNEILYFARSENAGSSITIHLFRDSPTKTFAVINVAPVFGGQSYADEAKEKMDELLKAVGIDSSDGPSSDEMKNRLLLHRGH